MTPIGGTPYFGTQHQPAFTSGLGLVFRIWSSDGTGAGTKLRAEFDHSDDSESLPRDFFRAGTWTLFHAEDPAHGDELRAIAP